MHTVVEDRLEDPTRNEALLNTRANDSLICRPTFAIAAQQTMPTRGRRYTTTTGMVAVLQALMHRLIYIVQKIGGRLLRKDTLPIKSRIDTHTMISPIEQKPASLLRQAPHHRQLTKLTHRIFHAQYHCWT
jgi:hypothetical protein